MDRRVINLLCVVVIVLIGVAGSLFWEDLQGLNADPCLTMFLFPDPYPTAVELAESHGIDPQSITDYKWGYNSGQVWILAAYGEQNDGHPICMSGDPNNPLPVILHEGE